MASINDDWQMEAVHEQFDVFGSLIVPYQKINTESKNGLSMAVLQVVRKHLQLSNDYVASLKTPSETTESVVNTLRAICKGMKKNVLEFSFAVIVTNQNVFSRGLCKIPIFIVNLGNFSIFIDINSKMFRSWDAFMLQNSLPGCKFCFPVNGRYNVGDKLKIDFASSPAATQSLVKTSMFSGFVGKIIEVATVAATCLIKVAPICYKVITDLRPVAERFIKKLFTMKDKIFALHSLLFELGTKKRQVWDVMVPAFNIIILLSNFILSEVTLAWKAGKEILHEAYKQLQSKFPKFFATASASSQHDFLALTESVDSEAVKTINDAKQKVCAATMFTNNKTHLQSIFSNSITDCALEKGGKPFEKTTNNILDVTKEIADDQKLTNLDELKNMFESVSHLVFEEYRHEIDCYTKGLKAAKLASKNFDEDVYNKSLGIIGDPEDYFMKEVLKSSQKNLRCMFKIKAKSNELKANAKIVLIPLYKKHSDDDVDGMYRCIGVRGTGKFSTSDLLSVLQEHFGNLSNVKNASIKDVGCSMMFSSDELIVVGTQQVNDENTSEGLVFCQRGGGS